VNNPHAESESLVLIVEQAIVRKDRFRPDCSTRDGKFQATLFAGVTDDPRQGLLFGESVVDYSQEG
jgi:hypothetical protein